ncbi:FAD-dependent oxidoreductase [Pseudomonas oryzihabitans]|uniref:flavin monoamine oxidase family protein n=1 Tax=Pseudomonas oryzihabitans TaxID=47885 RepID=UPI002895F46C|nr:FAD-dependent oxidoreductase [Pseudomonas oryzihabitans]MDT3722633.1 FAD-dependent oxidoreductase [Pseudomonas oryzihabitans]
MRIAIIGGGLSGLYAALLLERQGITDYVLLEARDRLGGRVSSAITVDAQGLMGGAFDMGPSWFWPDYQPNLDQLVTELGLTRFEQHEQGEILLERRGDAPAQRVSGYGSAPVSMRLEGGMAALIDAIRMQLNPSRLMRGQLLRKLTLAGGHVILETRDPDGRIASWSADQVLLAMPPRLFIGTIECSPPLPSDLVRQWQQTPTWMAPHAKFVAVYPTPFWRQDGLSGLARSAIGPMAEIHDASTPSGPAALFGFLGVDATARQQVDARHLEMLCQRQLVRLFGPQAAEPTMTYFKDWAQDPLTATASDWHASPHHTEAPWQRAVGTPWTDHLIGIGSEWSTNYPGYLAGALEAANLGIQHLRRR